MNKMCPDCGFDTLVTYEGGRKEEHPAVVRTTDNNWLCVVCRHEWKVNQGSVSRVKKDD